MLAYGLAQASPIEVTPVADGDKGNGGRVSGSMIFITLLLSALGGAVGYAVGYERAASKNGRRSSRNNGRRYPSM